ncbi:MAG: ribbon-helix-helix domain-containing protein [Candidatus Bathyarchaeota archaeon]|nr:ribbon-helix-helix domain-containing protein [Candidatus Bathyarchaeota archaeon]
MKTLKISDQFHSELTAIVGQLTAKSGEIKTYEDAIEALLHQSVVMPFELVQEIEVFIANNKQLGYSTKEEFLREAARWLMNQLSKEQFKAAAQTTGKQTQTGAETYG